jgi:hypothetical protein
MPTTPMIDLRKAAGNAVMDWKWSVEMGSGLRVLIDVGSINIEES